MPFKLKNFAYKDTSLTLWNTGNVSITTDHSVDPQEIEAVLTEQGIVTPPQTTAFLEAMNQQVVEKISRTFLLTMEHADTDYQDYVCNHGIYRIYKNEMKLEMKLSPDATLEAILEDFRILGIRYGAQAEAIQQQLKEHSGEFFVAVLGAPPVAPDPRRYSFEYLTERPVPLCMKQKGKVMFLDFTLQNRVLKNDRLATIIATNPGSNGTTITGWTLPKPLIWQKEVTLGNNVYKKDDAVYASREGIVPFDEHMISVNPTKVINRPVTNKKIDFDGTLIIQNTVTNSVLKATRDIIIHGLVQDSEISVFGFAYLLTGISGDHSTINASYDVFCPYAYSTKVTSVMGNIYIAYEAYNSTLKAKGPIIVEKMFAGGLIESAASIKLHTAGNEKTEIATVLQLTVHPEEEDQLETAKDELRQTDQQLKLLVFHKRRYEIENTARKKQLQRDPIYIKFTKTERILVDHIDKFRNHIASLKAFLADRTTRTILVFGKIYPGTKIIMNDLEYEIKEDDYASSFTLGEYGIMRKRYA